MIYRERERERERDIVLHASSSPEEFFFPQTPAGRARRPERKGTVNFQTKNL